MGALDDFPTQVSQSKSLALAGAAGSLRVPARPSHLALIGTVVRWFAALAGLNEEKSGELEVAVDEACTNIIRYAFSEGEVGDMTVVCSPRDDGLEVTILDKGRPFDPDQGMEIARKKRAEDLASGGMGWLLIRRLTDGVDYRHDEREGNRLTLIKHKETP